MTTGESLRMLGAESVALGNTSLWSQLSQAVPDAQSPTEITPAFAGLPGRVVAAILPHTEADEWAILMSFLTAFGSLVGPGPHVMVGADVHRANLFTALVGRSSKARKGSSWSPVAAVLNGVDPGWLSEVKAGGLGSGEGLVSAASDKTGPGPSSPTAGRTVFVIETELSAILRVMHREGSTLSQVLRNAWDTGDMRVTTKNSTLRASGAHVSVLAHITQDEVRRELWSRDASSGFGNRFMWFTVGRSKLLPEPDPFAGAGLTNLANEVRSASDRGRTASRLQRTAAAKEQWASIYPDLSRDRSGLAGELANRAEAQVTRLALVYALADGSGEIGTEHILSAVDVWSYCESSIEQLFGGSSGDPVLDTVLTALTTRGSMSRTEIRDLFSRHQPKRRLDEVMEALLASGRVQRTLVRGPGRPAEFWQLSETEQAR